ncbi:MAG TPA: hypothetical protein PKE39_15285 [Ignavibacteria bacterium]|nr:hypothetical protein [Ignavibacteria bacterium]HMR00385.1 hypothetical protein [Ignavibacteria bacterium]
MWEEITILFFANFQLVLGWFLGLLSAVIIDWLRNFKEKREVKRGILAEVKDLQYRLVGLCFLTTLNSNIITQEWAKWIRPLHTKLMSSGEFEYVANTSEMVEKLSKLSDEEYFIYLTGFQPIYQTNNKGITQNIVKFNMPYTESKYGSISKLGEKFQSSISKLKRDIDVLNNDADQIWFYQTKTFDKLSDMNHEVVVKNIEEISNRISRNTVPLIKLTQNILKL